MEFQVQSIYLIYAGLIVCAILNIAYPKEYVLFIKLIYNKYTIWYYCFRIFYVLLYNIWYICDTVLCCVTVCDGHA